MDATQTQHDLHVSRTKDADGWTVAADLHPLADDEVTVDCVGETAVVAVDTPMLRTEIDIDLPDGDGTATLNNGVLVVENTE